MKVISGTIKNIEPDGGYQGQNGYIYTFQLTIRDGNKEATGQIGSKSQTYPVKVGEQISVEMTDTEHGVRFKKYNAQYAGQGGGQTAGNQAQPGRDYDKENHGKCFSLILQSAIRRDGLALDDLALARDRVEAMLKSVTSHASKTLENISKRVMLLWKEIQDDIGLDLHEGWIYDFTKGTVIKKEKVE